MKIFNQQQTRSLDQITVSAQQISSLSLMERAVSYLHQEIYQILQPSHKHLHIFVGAGNNGGDGIGLARNLLVLGLQVSVYYCPYKKATEETQAMLDKIQQRSRVNLITIRQASDFPKIEPEDLIIDALFGQGISRPVEGLWAQLILHINQSLAPVISIDLPSGMHPDRSMAGPKIKATYTLAIGAPKKAFFYSENDDHIGQWSWIDIDWPTSAIEEMTTQHFYIDASVIDKIKLKPRKKFSHKGNFGHALLINGSYGKMGAAILAAKACLRSGVGLLTCHVPRIGYPIMQTAVPEAMVSIDDHDFYFHSKINTDKYSAIGIGSGLDHKSGVKEALYYLLTACQSPLVLDADALNIIASNGNWLTDIPDQSILTPHPGEFRRLFGDWSNDEEKLEKQVKISIENQLYIVLKGAHTSISTPQGELYFNSTGNPGMATPGSGDTLTGILTGFLAKGLSPLESCILGVYIHGLAGDLAKQKWGETALISSDIIEHLGQAFQTLISTDL